MAKGVTMVAIEGNASVSDESSLIDNTIIAGRQRKTPSVGTLCDAVLCYLNTKMH